MKAAIIEDDEIHADLLEKYLLEWGRLKNITLEISRYLDAESFLFEFEPGIAFDVLPGIWKKAMKLKQCTTW